jgi:hypothetical protein
MDKPANVVIEWNESHGGYWSGLADTVPGATVHRHGTNGFAILPVKAFSLDDHQFVSVKLEQKNGETLQVWIPREIVRSIVQGVVDLSKAFTFAGAKIK